MIEVAYDRYKETGRFYYELYKCDLSTNKLSKFEHDSVLIGKDALEEMNDFFCGFTIDEVCLDEYLPNDEYVKYHELPYEIRKDYMTENNPLIKYISSKIDGYEDASECKIIHKSDGKLLGIIRCIRTDEQEEDWVSYEEEQIEEYRQYNSIKTMNSDYSFDIDDFECFYNKAFADDPAVTKDEAIAVYIDLINHCIDPTDEFDRNEFDEYIKKQEDSTVTSRVDAVHDYFVYLIERDYFSKEYDYDEFDDAYVNNGW